MWWKIFWSNHHSSLLSAVLWHWLRVITCHVMVQRSGQLENLLTLITQRFLCFCGGTLPFIMLCCQEVIESRTGRRTESAADLLIYYLFLIFKLSSTSFSLCVFLSTWACVASLSSGGSVPGLQAGEPGPAWKQHHRGVSVGSPPAPRLPPSAGPQGSRQPLHVWSFPLQGGTQAAGIHSSHATVGKSISNGCVWMRGRTGRRIDII